MAGVHGLEHVKGFGATDLADHDAIGAHAQRVAYEFADRHLALPLDVLGARLEPEHVALVQLELRRVLDRDDPVLVRDSGRQRIQEGRLA